MLIADYNTNTLMIFVAPEKKESSFEKNKGVVRIFDPVNNKTLGYNFLGILGFKKSGPILLDKKMVEKLNKILLRAGFKDELIADISPKFVIGKVDSLSEHPKSKHLKIAQVDINKKEDIQLVSGSPNISVGIKTVVCLPGAMMPSGQIIWPGKLLGIDSYGMMASPRELNLKNAPNRPGLIVLPTNFGKIGEPFNFQRGNKLEFKK